MRNRITALSEVGNSTFGVRSRIGGQAGVAGLGEVSNGWNVLPGLDNASRAIPTESGTIKLGQDFSIALNEALIHHGIPGEVQNDGVISQFHVEQLGQLVLSPGVGAAFSNDLGANAVKMISDSEFQKFAVAALTVENEMAELIPRLKFAATIPSVQQGAKATGATSGSLALPIFGGLTLLYFIVARR